MPVLPHDARRPRRLVHEFHAPRFRRLCRGLGLEVYPAPPGNQPVLAEMAKIPFLGINGDNLDVADSRAYTNSLAALGGDATTVFLPDVGQHGNGHTLAIEKNNEAIADIIQKWIDGHVK